MHVGCQTLWRPLMIAECPRGRTPVDMYVCYEGPCGLLQGMYMNICVMCVYTYMYVCVCIYIYIYVISLACIVLSDGARDMLPASSHQQSGGVLPSNCLWLQEKDNRHIPVRVTTVVPMSLPSLCAFAQCKVPPSLCCPLGPSRSPSLPSPLPFLPIPTPLPFLPVPTALSSSQTPALSFLLLSLAGVVQEGPDHFIKIPIDNNIPT